MSSLKFPAKRARVNKMQRNIGIQPTRVTRSEFRTDTERRASRHGPWWTVEVEWVMPRAHWGMKQSSEVSGPPDPLVVCDSNFSTL